MLSFHNDHSIKEKYLSRVIAHREADRIIKGTGWENGKGCAVGCTLENYDHSRYPIELGLPECLARLEDIIFENLPKEKAILWPELFLSSIPVGVDTEIVIHQVSIKRLDRLLKIQNSLLGNNNQEIENIINQVIISIEIVKKCHQNEINKTYCDWSDAESAAWSAARDAECAASAAWSAARDAECAEYAAASAARSAAWYAAWSAASAAWQQEADDLIDCLKELK